MIAVIGAGLTGKKVLDILKKKKTPAFGTSTSDPTFKIFDINQSQLPEATHYIFCLPPSRYEINTILEKLKLIKEKRIIFISSTSVFKNTGEVIFEDSERIETTDNTKKLIAIENQLLSYRNATIIRPAGLYCERSHPGKYLSGKRNIKNSNHRINLVSRNFVAEKIVEVIKKSDIKSVNLVNINHPLKEEYYNSYCKRNSLPLIEFDSKSNSKKDKLVSSNNSSFIDQNPL